MLKRLSLVLASAMLVLAVGCKSKPKDEAANPNPENGSMDAAVSSKDINVDPLGSDGGKISGLQSVNFDYDSATLSEDLRQKLASNADWIKKNPNYTVQVEGHCDSRGSVEYNLALGERRAKSVKNYLVSLGVDSKRLTIISYGEEKPLDTGDSEQAYAKNRRANFVPLAP
jgi:peptidoglycan-associated lipoprotein